MAGSGRLAPCQRCPFLGKEAGPVLSGMSAERGGSSAIHVTPTVKSEPGETWGGPVPSD